MRKIFKFLFVLLINMVSSIGFAHDFEQDGIYYNITSSLTVSVTYKGTSSSSAAYKGSVAIPSFVTYNNKDYSVTGITSYAFNNCTQLSGITIPMTIGSVADNAFQGCTNLNFVSIHCNTTPLCFRGMTSIKVLYLDGVEKIANNAFAKCTGIISVDMSSVTEIGENSFSGCTGITNINFPETLTLIGASAFSGCTNIPSLSIPGSVATIEKLAFQNCTKISSLNLNYGTTSLKMEEGSISPFYGCSSIANIVVNRDFTVSYSSPFSVLGDFSVSYGYYVNKVSKCAFRNCSGLKNVEFGSAVTSIGDDAFNGCNSLTSIEIPKNITSIGERAFSGCAALTSVYLNTETINTWLRGLSSIKEITIGENVKTIYDGAFAYCSGIVKVNINAENPTIGSAFSGCSKLGAVVLNCATVGKWFQGMTSLNTVTIGKNTTSILDGAFENCSKLTSITLGPNVLTIGSHAFYKCTSLLSIDIPSEPYGIVSTTIGNSAFYGCTSLSSINIPNTLKTIGSYAFYNCSALQSFYIPNGVQSIGSSAFYGCNALRSVTLNCTEVKDWFRELTSISRITLMNSVSTISSNAFYGCTGLTEIEFGGSVKTIGDCAFSKCKNLQSLYIPVTVATIYSTSFLYCSGLQQISVAPGNTKYDSRDNCNAIIQKSNNSLILGCNTTKIPRTVTGLGDNAFSGCNFNSFEVPRQITTIGNAVFRSCRTISDYSVEDGNNVFYVPKGSHAIVKKSTKELVAACPQTIIPEDILSIQDYAFFDYQIPSITLPDRITKIGNYAFAYNNFSKINLPDNIKDIGEGCFRSCNKLEEIMIPQQVSIINDRLFYYCTALQKIILPKSITKVSRNAFYFCNNLSDIYCYAEQVPIREGDGYSSGYVESAITLHVPENLVKLYKDMYEWSRFGNIVALTDNDPGPKIQFEDAAVKAICVSNWDVNGDGELSREEAAQVKDIRNILKSNEEITSFNELQYFTGLTNIGEYAFYGCSSLTSVTIPNSVERIGNSAFEGCSGLTSVICRAINVPSTDSDCFKSVSTSAATLYVPASSIKAYKSADQWKDFGIIMSIDGSIPGDVNGDGEVNGADIVAVINYVLNDSKTDGDVNDDGEVNGADIVAVINYVLSYTGDEARQQTYYAHRAPVRPVDTCNRLSANTDADGISVGLTNETDFTAFQFILQLPDGCELTNVDADASRLGSNVLQYRRIADGRYFVLGYNMDNESIAGQDGTLLHLQLAGNISEGASVTDVMFFTPEAETHRLAGIHIDLVTGMTSLENATEDTGNIYDVHGRIVMTAGQYAKQKNLLPTGIYIRNGSKFIVK